MELLEASLRFLHLLAAAAWLGAALYFVAVLNPAIARAGPDGTAMLRALATRSRTALYMPLVGGLTVVAGLGLYVAEEAHAIYLDSQLRILNAGATLGLVAAVFGGVMEGRTTRRIRDAALRNETALLSLEAARLRGQGLVSAALLVLALGAMATFRYF